MVMFTGNKYYCPKCRTSFIVSDKLRVATEPANYCPGCGERTAKFTSAFWVVESTSQAARYG